MGRYEAIWGANRGDVRESSQKWRQKRPYGWMDSIGKMRLLFIVNLRRQKKSGVCVVFLCCIPAPSQRTPCTRPPPTTAPQRPPFWTLPLRSISKGPETDPCPEGPRSRELPQNPPIMLLFLFLFRIGVGAVRSISLAQVSDHLCRAVPAGRTHHSATRVRPRPT